MRDRIFKLSPIHASVIISFHEFIEFSESYAPLRKNSNKIPYPAHPRRPPELEIGLFQVFEVLQCLVKSDLNGFNLIR